MQFSVLITTYNQKDYFTECLESALMQSYKEKYQIVVVDDHSTDGTEACYTFKPPKHVQLDIVRNRANLGIQKSFNVGLYHCEGDWIVRLDHDDKLLPETLEEVSKSLAELKDKKVGLLYSDLKNNYGAVVKYPEFIPGRIMSCFRIGHLQIMRRKALESINGWRIGLEYAADTACMIDLCEAGWKLQHVDKVLVWNRLHKEQYTQRYVAEGGDPNAAKKGIVDRALALRPDMWIEAREQVIVDTSTHLWATEALAVRPFCHGMGLDLGCSTRKKYPLAIGIDKDRAGGKVAEIVRDVEKEELPFLDGSLDYITCSHLIEHVEKPVLCMEKWLKKIKKGGYLLLIVPDTNYVPKMGTPGGDPTHKHDFTPETFKTVVYELEQRNGIDVVSYDTIKNRWSFDVFLRKTT